MDRLPPLPDLHERRVNRPGLARTGSVAESSRTGYTQWTQYTSETATQDIHTMLALSHFPPPPTTIPSPTTPPTSNPPVSPPYGRRPPGSSKSATRTSSHTSHLSFSTNQEEILQDYFIASLLNGTGAFPRSERQPSPQRTDFPPTPTIVPASGRPSPDSRLQYVPTSPTLSAYTHRTSVPGPLSPPPLEPTPPLPPLPSPLTQAYFPSNAQHLPPPQTIESESSSSGNPSVAYTSASHGTTIVRVSSPPHGGLPPLPPTPGFTTVVGYARAEYLPKAIAVASPPPPIIIPVNRSSTNLIDLASPHPPERAQLSPRVSRFPSTPDIPEGTDTLAPLAGPSRFRISTTPSPRTEAPPNVPEDVTSHDDHVPSTSYFSRDRFKHRISMSSIFSKFSRSTSISSKHGGRYARRGTKKDLPPLPKRPDDPKEIKQSEAEMALPALLNRAGFLSQLLETGRLPARNSTSIYHGVGSLQQPHTPGWGDTTPEPPSSFSGANSASVVPSDTPPNGTTEGAPWEYSSGSGYVDETAVRNRTSQSIRSFFTRGTTTDRSGHFNVLDEELQRRYLEEIAAQGRHSGDPSVGSGGPHVHPPSDPGSEKPRRITIVDRPPPSRSLRSIPPPWRWKRNTILAVLVNMSLVFAVIATAVGLTWKKNSSGSSSGSSSGYHCSGNFTGSQCNLDATCICTTPGAVCNPLAKSISDALPSTNNAMKTNYTTQSVALTLWDMQGSPVGGNCAQQAVLLDINPSHADDTHLQWARSAVLWSALQSEDGAASAELREFVTALDYSKTDQSDSSSNQTTLATDQGSVGPFQKLSSGFLFDFAQMAVTAPSLTWRAAAAPSDAETGQVSESMEGVLDRFYTSSNALSTQSSTPLQNYWVKDLNLDISLLSKFVAAVQSSPVLLPFDMTLGDNNKSLPSIMQLHDPKTVSFPPPLGCNPMMSASQLQVLNSIEQNAFKLPQVAAVPSSFDFSCFASRPVYGVLDVLRLRLPFLDKTDQAPLQAAVLSADAASRALIRPGTVLSLFPSVDSADAPASAVRQRSYGTLKYLNHVLLAWLKSLPLTQASAIATFVANSSPTSGPPTSSALNATALASVPGLEVAVFGTIGPADVDHSVASFATTSGSLFFGSQTGGVFREWAANTATSSTSVVWADSSTSAKVVKETVKEDSTFEAVWQGASTMITNANVMGKVTGASDVATVVGVFEQIGYLGS